MSVLQILVRQDPAWRVLPRGVVTSLCLGLLFRIEPDLARGVVTLNTDDLPGGFGPMYLVVMILVMTFVLSSNSWTRASRLSTGLPLPARLTWVVRTGSLAAVAGATIFVMALVLGLSLTQTGPVLNPVIALAALRATATSLVLILLYQLPLAEQDRIPITPEYVIFVIFVTLIIVPFSASGITSIAGTIFFFTISFALGAWLWVRAPRTWSVGPSVAESDSPVWSSDNSGGAEGRDTASDWAALPAPTRPRLVIHRVLLRALNGFLPLWIMLIGIAGAAIVVVLEFFDGTNAFLPLVLVAAWHLPVLQMTLERMTPFDPLPISRRALWAQTFGPVMAMVIVGAATGFLINGVHPNGRTHVHFRDGAIQVPWEYFDIAPDGVPPTVTAPWGESVTPAADPLWRGKRPALYDPYEVTIESSPRFVEYQIRRAVAAAYGVPLQSIAPTDTAGDVDRDTHIVEMTRGRSADGRSRSAAATLILFTLIVTILMIPALFQYGSSVHRKLFKWALMGTLILFGTIAVAIAVARLSGSIETWYVGALVSIGIRHLAAWIPLPTAILWAVSVTFWFGAYLLMGSIFKRIELPGRNTVNRFAEEY